MSPTPNARSRSGVAGKLLVTALLAGIAFLGSYAFAQAGDNNPPPAPIPEGQPPALDPVRLSLEGHPQADYYLHDPKGQAVRAEFETGWTAVQIGEGPKDIAWMPTAFLWGHTAPNRGDVSEVVDGDGDVLGYWALDGGFTPLSSFDADSAHSIYQVPWPD